MEAPERILSSADDGGWKDVAYVRADLYGDLVQDIGEKRDALVAAEKRICELETELADYKATHKYAYIVELEKQDVLQKRRIAELEARPPYEIGAG